jgi:hypothetical protein
MLPPLEQYEELVYALVERFPTIEASTLVVKRRGATVADVEGEVFFAGGRLALVVRETVDFADGRIQRYSYEMKEGEETRYWYDSQPHPTDPTLASTHPHHKHVPPDIKHNRQPAPELSFEQPNLLFLVREVEQILAEEEAADSSGTSP